MSRAHPFMFPTLLAGTVARDWTGYFLPLLKKVNLLSLTKVDPDMPDSEVTVEYLVDQVWIVGDPDEVTRKLQRLQQDTGGFGTLLVIAHEWEPRAAWAVDDPARGGGSPPPVASAPARRITRDAMTSSRVTGSAA